MKDAPTTFLKAMKQIGEYLHRDARYTWYGLGGRNTPPLNSPCVVACADETLDNRISLPDYATLALAYAQIINGEVRWFGVTNGYQEVKELRDIAYFVAIAEADRVLHPGAVKNENKRTQDTYAEHEVYEVNGFRVVDATDTGIRPHDDLIWVGYGGRDGRWLSPSNALELAVAITKAANGNLSRRGQSVPNS